MISACPIFCLLDHAVSVFPETMLNIEDEDRYSKRDRVARPPVRRKNTVRYELYIADKCKYIWFSENVKNTMRRIVTHCHTYNTIASSKWQALRPRDRAVVSGVMRVLGIVA